ncbi:hypothetical protein BDQ12DRAFT_732027 [Crucibulum laeve]|uniref:BRCT domain-containing protein n=1 Tax=Crucibulum laeve TaxID=68775 RepID=A0A5C3MCA2_9AGAR|nr:hypothetical protein BDQ12DRAFT_732027 [Crucibulum laeve]
MAHSHYSEDEDDKRLLFEDENGFGIGFFLHKSIKSADQQKKLIQDIEENGGAILDNVRDANTVLVHPMFNLRDALQTAYHIDDDKHIRNTTVEPASFIQKCIRENRFCHRVRAKEGMGGVGPGHTRTPFTDDDVARLCNFIARKLPNKTAGGRLGTTMYRELEIAGSLRDETSYARRHTAQSWKEHYKKNQDLLDPIIDEIVAREKPPAAQVYFRDRNAKKGWRSHNRAVEEEDDEEGEPPRRKEGEEEEEEEEEGPEYGNEITFVNSRRQSSGSGRKRHHDASIEPPTPKRRRTQAQSFNSQSGNRYRHGPDAAGNQSSDDQDGPENDDSRPPSPTLVNQEEQRQKSHSTPRQAAQSQRTSPGVSSLKPRSARRPHNSINSPNPPPRNNSNPRQSKVIDILDDEGNDAQAGPSIHSNPPGIRRSKKATQAEPSQVLVAELSPSRNTGPSRQTSNNNAQVVLSSVSPAQPMQPKKGKRAANKKASAAPRPVEAPYHNTRSRSRSVEPSMLPPIKPRGKEKSKKLAQEQERNEQGGGPAFEPQLEGIREDMDMGDPPAAAETPSVPIAQTLEEEMDVADLLINDQSLSVRSVSVQQESLDSDDAQTNRILRASQVQQRRNVPIVPSSLFQDINPEDMLARFQSENAPRYSLPPAPPTAGPSKRNAELRKEGGRPRHSEPSALPPARNRDGSVLSQNAFFTPQRRSPMKAKIASNSSEESFPLSGTRASAVKKQLRQEEKQTPYTPPAGTKAALYASDTTKRRLRSRNPY